MAYFYQENCSMVRNGMTHSLPLVLHNKKIRASLRRWD